MELTLSVIKADVGSIGGHTKPLTAMVEKASSRLRQAVKDNLLIDGMAYHIGDDIILVMSHTAGKNDTGVHQFAWDTFIEATKIASEHGLYGAGQDLLVDAPSSNVRGAGPGVAEVTFEHKLSGHRPAESFMLFAADKCSPGAYNLPTYLAFADPMYCAGLMLPKMIKGFAFDVIDMNHADKDSIVRLNAPEDGYKIAALLRDNERFGIDSIWSRTYDEQAAAVSAQRLHAIAGKYTGKDDPVVLVRTQGIFPAPEELLMPYAKAHYVGGGSRGSHVMPLMPVPINTPASGMYCLPIVSALGFSVDKLGQFSAGYIDFFDSKAWDLVRLKAQEKALHIRDQGWSGAAMLPYGELEYGGFRDTIEELMQRFKIREAD
ncbi:fructose 1,6-bisphosphatase [bacterium]|jgi:fructose 1,6-bisphosphate aldolase/phosphatase|nr:fructose 1,6-bisphosphatase [bacterium]MBT3903453.1 fructose 1,6-bisphosphatase [bacterium]MBT4577809.1 fructose 1,6-bisphosphatase [bacterium]MBT5346041.1 fructose 1,6-bisphosphatase [bacterium]MBT6130953.1 fructose 1,6-bisphosphatase [bacterium]